METLNMGTLFVLAILLCVVGCVIRNMVKARMKGKSVICGCDCEHCNGQCHK